MNKKDEKTLETEKRKVPFNALRKGVMVGLLGVTLGLGCLGLAGCTTGNNGSRWFCGVDTPTNQGQNGDYYLDTDDYILYNKREGQWHIVMTNFGKPGDDGSDGVDGASILVGDAEPSDSLGEDGDFFINKSNWDVYNKSSAKWEKTGNIKGDKGDKGNTGADGKDGTNICVGYDGYIWQDGERTSFKLYQDATDRENVVEDTIGVYTTMGYHKGEYVDLSSNTIALMANYMPNIGATQYSNTRVSEIQIIANSKGTIQIGTAKLSDIATARKKGTALTAKTTSYNVVAGVNTLKVGIQVGEDETIVLGGNGSTAKVYVVKNLPVSDEDGNFALIDGGTHKNIVSQTNKIDDTLAISVSAVAVSSTYPSVATYQAEELSGYYSTTDGNYRLNYQNAPIFLKDYTIFENKTIEKLLLPIMYVSSTSVKPVITLQVVKQGYINDGSNFDTYFVNQYELDLSSYLGTLTDTTVLKWIEVDVSHLNITIQKGEMLGFGKKTDTAFIAIDKKVHTSISEFNIYLPSYRDTLFTQNVFLDVYTTSSDFSGHLTELEEKEAEAKAQNEVLKAEQLKTVLSGKNLSILGDSISTYVGYSNNTDNNSTTGSNSVEYRGNNQGVISVEQTWWKQTANDTTMNILVNNSSAGDRVATGGQTRCEQLHDDNGENSGTNPDIIAVYIGINDIRDSSMTVERFTANYTTMINSIKTKYSDAKIFLFTHTPYSYRDSYIGTEILEQYNDAIRNLAKETENCYLVDLFEDSGITDTNYSTYCNDGLHPNAMGMDLITECFKNALYEAYVANADET